MCCLCSSTPSPCASAIIPLFWLAFDPPHRSSFPPTISFYLSKPYFPFIPLVEFINQPHPLLAICGTVAVYPSILHIVDCCLACFVLYYFFLWFYHPLLAIRGTVAVYPSNLHGWLLHVACFVLYYFFLWFYYRRHIHLCYMMYLSKLSLPSNYSLGENNYYHWRISLSTIATSPAIGTL